MCHVRERGEVFIGLWWGNPKAKDHLGSPRIRLDGNIKMDLEEKR
jgi:hypothetical protein